MKLLHKKISKKMMITEALMANEKLSELLFDVGFHCIGCGMAQMETLEQGCKAHGMTDKEIDDLVKKVNGEEKKKRKKK